MNKTTLVWAGALGALVFALALVMVSQPASATNDPPSGGGTVTGDWTVTDSRSYSSVTITVQDGNLYIANGGTLTLTTVRLVFSQTIYPGYNYTLEVQSGGTLSTASRSTISSSSTAVHYNFAIRSGGAATMNDTTVSETWGDVGSWKAGIQIYSSGVSITNCSITNGMTGGVSIFDCSPTFYKNSVYRNGQDGQCATYCFGIYAWNTKTNFTSNQVYENVYKNQYYTAYSSSGSPGGYYYYGSQWVTYGGYSGNGQWYYNIGYCYRYLYEYDYRKANIWGTGVLIQGNSKATFYNNSVTKNGYQQPGGGYSYSNTYDGAGYAYSPYYYQWYGYYYSSFYTYKYSYQYYSFSNYGYGLLVENSTVDITGNTFDRNGLEPYHNYFNGADSACYYTGEAIRMYQSAGNITWNTIQNSPTLVNIINTTTDINNNTLLGDYLGNNPASPYSSGIVQSQVVYGIKCVGSTPDINYNKITIQYSTYPYLYVNGRYWWWAARAYAIDIGPINRPYTFQGNKITIQEGYYGAASSWFFNGSQNADMKILDSSFEFKYTGFQTSPYGTNTMLNLGNRYNLLVDNCTFKGAYQANANAGTVPNNIMAPKVSALTVSYGTAVTVANSTFSGCDWCIQANYACNLNVQNVVFTTCGYAVQPLYATKASVKNVKITGTGVGVMAGYASSVDLFNVTMATCDNGVQITDFSTGKVNACSITGTKVASLAVESRSSATFDGTPLSGNGKGLQAIMSSVIIRDCTMNHGLEFYIDKGALVEVMNTPHMRGSVQILDNESYLNVSWRISIVVVWQNDLPVIGASLRFATITGQEVYTDTTNENGTTAEKIWIKEYMAHMGTVYKYTPHRITASKGRASSTDLFFIDKSVELRFRLVDTIPPALSVRTPFDGQNLNYSMVKFEGLASDPESGLTGGSIEMNIDNKGWVPIEVDAFDRWSYTRPLGDGLHVVRLRADDLAGNVARAALQFTVDTQGPVLQVFTPTEGCYTNQRTVSVSGITEEGALVTVNGISVTLARRSFSSKLSLEDGPNTITVVASDASGNARMVTVHVTLDTQPPLLDITSPGDGMHTNQDPVSVVGLTEPQAIVRVNGVRAPFSENRFEALVGLSEGINTVSVSATDLAGNTAKRTLVVYLDTAAPALTMFTPRDGLWTNQSRVLVTGATEDGALVTINGQNTNVISTVFSGYVSLLEGQNKITVVARDRAQNTQAYTRVVYLDTRSPDLILTAPTDRSNHATRVVAVVGSVDWGADVTVNGEPVMVTDFLFTTTVQFAQDGPQTIEVVARDQAGNTAIETRSVGIDTTVPEVSLSFPTDGTRTRQRMVTVNGQTEAYATIVVNTETVLVVGRDGLFSVPVMLEDGENRLTVRSTDAAGNGATATVTVIKPVAKPAPKEDLTWALNLTGLLIGMGITLPAMTYALTEARRRRQAGVIAELEAAESARKEREAEQSRLAALPKVERMGKKAKVAPPPKEPESPPEPAPPAVLPEAPKPEAAPAEAAKTGLKDKSGATEVSPDEIDQETRLKGKAEEPAVQKAEEQAPASEASLKDKGGEAEGEAGETEGSGITKKK